MTVQKGKEGGAGRNQREKKMKKERNHCSGPAPVREECFPVRAHIYAVYPDRKPDTLPRRKGRRVPWAGTDLRHDRSEEKTISKVSLLSKSITINISTRRSKNPRKAISLQNDKTPKTVTDIVKKSKARESYVTNRQLLHKRPIFSHYYRK